MSRRIARLVFAGVFALVLVSGATAQTTGEGVTLARSTALVGEPVQLTLRVLTPAGSTVEVTPGTDSWAGIDVIRAEPPVPTPQGGQVLWTIEVVIAGFAPGMATFSPSVAVISGAAVEARTLAPATLTVASVLPPGVDLVLRPLAPPVAIEGGESPWLRPGIAAGIAGVALIFLGLMWLLARMLRRALRRRPAAPLLAPLAEEVPGLDGAERVLESDPVAAYRLMSTVVKKELARRYGLRATALTSNELRYRLERAGVDRWEARLVGGLLEECDAVIYAGYRPATERRVADLTMAREIVEVA